MPMVQAFPLGLILTGTTTTVLADGSTSFKLTALGTIELSDQKEVGLILLNFGPGMSDVLAGMEFLRTFERSIVLSEKGFVLVDTKYLTEALQEASAAVEAQRKAQEAAAATPASDSPTISKEPQVES